METLLKEFFKLLGEFGLVVIAAVWLIRKNIENRLAKDLEAHREKLRAETEKGLEIHRAKLKAETEKELAVLRTELSVVAKEHEVRYSKLHQKRAEIITELYRRFRELEKCLQAFEFQIEVFGKPLDRYVKPDDNPVQYFHDNKIFFTRELCFAINDLIYAMEKPIAEYEFIHLDLSEKEKVEIFKASKDTAREKILMQRIS